MAEEVNHPEHYNLHPSGIECIQIVRHMTFNSGNAMKYLWRAGLKAQPKDVPIEAHIRDLKKARWYLDDEIARLEEKK